jgi:hypothetical protein
LFVITISFYFPFSLSLLSYFQRLKTVCWGGPNIVPRAEWVKAGLAFHEAEQLQAYGLAATKGAAKSFQLVLQVGGDSSRLALITLRRRIFSSISCSRERAQKSPSK